MHRIPSFLAAILILLVTGCTDSSNETSPSTAPEVETTLSDSDSLLGVVWEWTGTITPVERFEAIDPARYTIRFQADGNIEAKFDCNRGSGSYEISNNRLSFGPLISTRMACPEDTQDSLFMGQLQRINLFFLQDGDLFLEMPVDSGTMRFRNGGNSESGGR